ncbi:hypothetical protein [Campylobacter porcelli]|uniref:Phage-Barnase-EndoU-ColicinE5/D-RelE-like nuclease domain-containing protein n=1 Tax=Campylobacter porcelli TaxID=1660073 RepID=A0A1X9SVP8_9BACT|nr:hypothetical protein [Campylobacter sp. RM6137]ARR00348.1 hypothetical protein CSUIS_0521 [Campylobacter sp. RM6137]
MICPNNFAKEVARASGRKMPDVSDELIKNGFDSVKKGDEIKKINTQKFSSNKVENDNLNSLYNSSDEMLQMAAKAREYEKVFKKEARGIHNVMNNGKKSTLIKRDLDSIDSAIKFERGFNNKNNKGYGAEHIIKHTINKDAKGYIIDIELANLGKNIREYIKNHKEPFIDKNGARIYEWENSDGVRFRAVVGDIQSKAPTTAVGSESGLALRERIITFYSDRNLNEPMNFKNPKLNKENSSHRDETTSELPQPTATDNIITFYSDRNLNEPIKEFGANYAEFYHDGKGAIDKLLTQRQGQVAGAFYKDGKDIDLVWGEFKVVKGEIKGYGLSKIEAKHLDDFAIFEGSTPQEKMANGINEIIQKGVLESKNGVDTIIYKKDNSEFRVGLSKGWNNQGDNRWIITAYNNKKVSSESIETSYHDTFTAKEPLANQRPNSTTTANKSQEVNIQPIKEFGTNYAEFYHDGKGAIDKLLTERQGQVAGAFEREELGDIDLVWGEVTDPIKHKGYGLAHILDKRMAEFMEQGLSKEEAEAKAIELINKLPDIIKNGEIIKLGENRVKIETPKDRAIIVLNYKGENNKWVLTAYKKDEALSQADLHQTKRNDPASSFIAEPTSKPNSTTTANKSQENILKGVDGKEYPNTVAGRWEKRVDEAFDWAYKNIYAKGVKSGIKGAGVVGRVFGSQESGAKIQRGLEKAFALQDEIGALSRLKSAYYRNNQVARMEAMKVYESLVKLEIDERVALFRMLDGQEVEPNLAGKLRPTYQKLRDKIDERAEQLISLGMLKGENAKENYIKYSYSQYYGKKDGAVGGFGIGKLRGRDENLSYEDRVQLGLIEDAAIAVTQTLNSQNSQIQKAILFKNLANEYAIDQPKDGYVKVSDESVGGGVKKYGALAGKYVPSAVYDDLQNAGLVSSIFDVIRPYTNVIDHIKVNLTVKNPATHGYNVLSNSVLAFLHGDLGANLKLMKLLATNKNSFNELLAKAEAMGLDTASDDIEMRNLLMTNDEVAKEALKSQNPLGYYIAASWQNIYLTKNSTTGRVARSAYAWEDKWFKLARFKKNLDMGMSDEAAFSDANSAYVDYSSHFNPALKVLDKTGVLPFFHFAVKSSIVVTKAAIKNPAKFAMLQTALIGSGASSLPYWFDSDQKDADNSRLPDWASSNYLPNLFGVKNQVQIGESGLYFNAARAMAGFRLSSIDDITGGGGLIGGLLDILRGRDSWGNDMVGKHDPAIKQLTARLDAFSKQFLPSITLGRYGRQGLAIATGNNPKNAYDEPMGLGELAGRFMGLRMINEKKELRSAAISAKNRYKKAKEKGDEGAMVVALNDFMACKAAASDMGVSLEALMKMRSRDVK